MAARLRRRETLLRAKEAAAAFGWIDKADGRVMSQFS